MTEARRSRKPLLYVSLVDNPDHGNPTVNRGRASADFNHHPENLRAGCALSLSLQKRMAVMGRGGITADSNPSTRKPKKAIAEAKGPIEPAQRGETPPGNSGHYCGAMSQQRTDSGAVSTPQKLLHLVGCRDPKARPPGGG
jgi:hypothetical protein